MFNTPRSPRPLIAVFLCVGLLASLVAIRARLHAEGSNKRVTLALEYDEVARLAQFTHRSVPEVLAAFRAADITAVVIQEDTFTTLEQTGLIHPSRTLLSNGPAITHVVVPAVLMERIKTELTARGIPTFATAVPDSTNTCFERDVDRTGAQAGESLPPFYVGVDYLNLRTIGVGLPRDECVTAARAKLNIAARVANFPGVSPDSARSVLTSVAQAGATVVIFNGEEVVGYRDLEPHVAEMLKDGQIEVTVPVSSGGRKSSTPVYLAYGAVEFGKQKGDEKLSAKLKGDLVRVHSIQTGEMGQLDREEAIDRFAKAARERNIRFCYIRLLTFSGLNPVEDNVKYVNAIARAIHHGTALTGGNLQFGLARRFQEVQAPKLSAPIIAVGAAAGFVWMTALLIPLPDRSQRLLFCGAALILALLSVLPGETGRKLVALFAGICLPAAACLYTYPSQAIPGDSPPKKCAATAIKTLFSASLITAIGISYVIGLLTARTFMVHTSQFLGIKAQHAIPLLLVSAAALFGGVPAAGETLKAFTERAARSYRNAMSEPARFGTLLFGLVVLAALALVIARTGNDAGVGVSGSELKMRAILDRLMPVRPRTKEFLVGHPAFVLGICWWLRGRKRFAIPAFVIGSLGQVSLLNTFCHIHTPVIISAWRDLIGLILGSILGLGIFFVLEKVAHRVGAKQ